MDWVDSTLQQDPISRRTLPGSVSFFTFVGQQSGDVSVSVSVSNLPSLRAKAKRSSQIIARSAPFDIGSTGVSRGQFYFQYR